jgi:multidrug efflux pump subunit AcrB
MKLPKIAIDNYQFVLVIVLMSVLTGTISYFTMPRSEDPVVKSPIFTILAVYPGTSPTDLEELIVDPIEDAVNEVEDIEEIRSQIQEGIVLIRVEATYGIEIDDKFDDGNGRTGKIIGIKRGNLFGDVANTVCHSSGTYIATTTSQGNWCNVGYVGE